MVDIVTRVNNVVNGFVWGPFGLALLLCTGLWLSVRTGFFQFRRMGYWLKHTIGAIFTNKDITAHTSKEDMAISQFQSMCTALAGTIGTGNIVGVATAIVSGGPGAIFWMWVMALLGDDDQLCGERAGRLLPPQERKRTSGTAARCII